jgi:hypothetical protein
MQRLLFSCLAVAIWAGSASALPPVSKEHASLLLARTCAKEAGWEITADCAAIHAVIQKRANLRSANFEQMLGWYSKTAVGRAWLEELDTSGTRPPSWPAGTHWDNYRGKWLALLEHARDILEGTVPVACDPDHWGDSRGDRSRAVRAGWTQIDCGSALNEFWSVRRPRRD